MAGGLRAVGNNADLAADQGIDQGRFANVGAANDGDMAGVEGGVHWGYCRTGPGDMLCIDEIFKICLVSSLDCQYNG